MNPLYEKYMKNVKPDDYLRVLDLTFLGVAVYVVEGEKVIYCNRALREMFGVKQSSILDINVKANRPWCYFFPEMLYFTMKYGFSRSIGVEHFLKDRPVWTKLRSFLVNHPDDSYIVIHAINVSVEKYLQLQKQQALATYKPDSVLKKIASDFLLTPTEVKVCTLLLMGYSTKEISNKLKISELTIATHRRNIRKKFNITKGRQTIFEFCLSQSFKLKLGDTQ